MKKRFFGILLMGAMVVASMSTFTSCKDYDDDINALKERIDANSQAIGEIQKLISNGGVVTSVTPIENGVRVTMSGNLGSFDITNGVNGKDGKDGAQGAPGEQGAPGQDGKDGTTWTIGEDGFWYENGEKTEYYALSTSTGSTTTTVVEASPKYYVPNAATGCFDIYQDGVKIEGTTISFLGTGSITATMDENMLTLYGIAGALGPNNSVSISLNGKLASLVFIPYLYLDGIESVEYKWIGDTTLRWETNPFKAEKGQNGHNLGHHATDILVNYHDIVGNLGDYRPNMLGRTVKWNPNRGSDPEDMGKWEVVQEWDPNRTTITSANLEWVYGPVWPVDYEMNPSNAAPKYSEDTPSFNILEPEVIYYNTRAAASALKVTSPENYEWYKDVWGDNPVYGYKNGNLTVGLKIERPDLLAPWPTDETINPNGNTDSSVSYPTGNSANGENPYREYNGTPKDNDPNGHYEWYGNNGQPSTWGNWYGDGTMSSIGTYKYQKNNKDNTLALQISTKDGETITSDYALIVPTRATLEGLIWYKQPMYIEPTLPCKDPNIDFNYGPNAPENARPDRVGDEEGWAFAEKYPAIKNNPKASGIACPANRVHIYDTPEEALADDDGAALELGALDPNGLDLKPYLGVHACIENLKHKEIAPGVYNDKPYDVVTWDYDEVKKWGLHWEFEFVDYRISTNTTGDSHYATFSDWTDDAAKDEVTNWNVKAANGEVTGTSKTGVVIARNVVAETGVTTVHQSTSSVDREPLVRVTLKRNSDGKVMLDGYILLHITHTKANLEVVDYPIQEREFNLCDPVQFSTNWSQFSRYILTDNLKQTIKNQETGMEILSFDEWYWADCMPNGAAVDPDDRTYVTDGINGGMTGTPYMIPGNGDGHRAYQLKIYNFGNDIYGNNPNLPAMGYTVTGGDADNKYCEWKNGNEFEDKALGDMWYDPNGEGPNNHTFFWILSEEELEYLTHDKNEPVIVTRWFRFIAKDYTRERIANQYTAPYPYIYIRCQMKLTRPATNWAKWAEKDKSYWYHWNPTADLNLKDGNAGLISDYGKETAGTVENGFSANVIDIMAPRDGKTIKGMKWEKQIHDNLARSNKPQLLKGEAGSPQFKRGKYYFTPKTNFKIKALNGIEYRLTVENKNYTQPFWILGTTPADIHNDRCYITLNPTANSKQFGKGYPWEKDFINSWADGTKTYDQLFCRYIWQHPYWNLENKGEYWKSSKDNFTYQPMDYLSANDVKYTQFTPAIANITAGSNKIKVLKDGTAVYNNDVEPEVYSKSGYGVSKKYYVGSDSHTWDEATLQGTLRWCSIIFDNEELKDPTGVLESEYRDDPDDANTNNIWRNAGVFNDSILYAENTATGVYTPIARIVQQEFRHDVNDVENMRACDIELIHWLPVGSTYQDFLNGNAVENYACYDVLNALGYPTKDHFGGECDYEHAHRFINHQLRGWVGVVAVNDCNIAQYVQQDEYDDDNIATFLASWERPINVKTFDPTYAIDAKTQENYVFIIDYLKMYDWRGEKAGYMWGDHYWFWAYYNIKEIDVDLRDSKVRTTLHHPELTNAAVLEPETWPTLGSITTQLRLWPVAIENPGTATARVTTAPVPADGPACYQFDLVDNGKNFTYAVNNDALKAYMGYPGTFPGIPTNKARFGGFYYENNKANVTDFYLYIPVTIHYEWGKFETHMCWKVEDTEGYHE